jgi:hypothetical protein
MRTAVILAILVSGLVVTASEQAPNLSGTWVATKDAPAGIGPAPSAVFGERFGLAVTGDNAVLTRPVRGNVASLATTLPLTGAEVSVTQTGRTCFGDSVQTNTATRQDTGFDFAITSNTGPGAATTKLAIVYKFRPGVGSQADTLIVESTVRDASGPKQVGTVYRRSTDALPPLLKGPNVTVAPATITSIGWLAGDWVGVVGGNDVEERWMSPAGGAMIGNSRSTRGNPASMVEFEYLCIAQRHGGLVYTAMPNGGGATDFLLTKISADSATFENPEHDFPRAITYTKRADGGVDATISGAPGQRVLTYSFKRK